MTVLCALTNYSKRHLIKKISHNITDIVLSLYHKLEKKLLNYGIDMWYLYYTLAIITLFYFILNYLYDIYEFLFKTMPRKIKNLFRGKIDLVAFDCDEPELSLSSSLLSKVEEVIEEVVESSGSSDKKSVSGSSDWN